MTFTSRTTAPWAVSAWRSSSSSPPCSPPAATGFKTPETIRIDLRGKLQTGVGIRDAAARIIHEIGPDAADYRVFEYTGDALAHLGVDARVKLCNLPIEIGAKSAIVPADEVVAQWMRERNIDGFEATRRRPRRHIRRNL